MKKCPSCGAEAPDKDFFCKICGTELTKVHTAKKFCPSCGHENIPDAKFCSNCGSQLEVEARSSRSSARALASPVGASPGLANSIREAFVTLVKPTPPIARPTAAVYTALQPYTSLTRYLVLGLFLFFAGLILSTSGLFLDAPLWFIVTISIVPILYVLWIYRQDRWEHEPHELVVLSLGWGAFSAALAIVLEELLLSEVYLPAWIGAPLVEEPVKVVGVYLLAANRRLGREFNDHLDGMLHGGAAGAGFAIAENFIYVLYMVVGGVPLLLAVLVRSTIGHVFYSALVGRWLGVAKVRRGYVKPVDLVPGLMAAMFFHGLWNSPLLDPILLLFGDVGGDYGFIVGLFLIASPYYTILYKYVKEALRDERLWGYSAGYAPVEK